MRARADERTDGMPVRNGGVSREVRGAKLRRDRGPRRVMLTFRVIDLLENAPYEGLIAFDRRSGSRIDVVRSQAHRIRRCRWPLRRSLLSFTLFGAPRARSAKYRSDHRSARGWMCVRRVLLESRDPRGRPSSSRMKRVVAKIERYASGRRFFPFPSFSNFNC